MIQILQGTISYAEVKWGKPEARAAKNTPLINLIDDMKGVGADGIELWGRHLDNLSEKQIGELAAGIEESGQKVAVLSAYSDFASSDESVKTSLKDAERWMKLKDIFKTSRIRVFAGGVASAQAAEEHWSRCVVGLKSLARMYDGTGTTFVIETHDNQLVDTPATCLRLMKALGEPSILLNYQYMMTDVKTELNTIYRWAAHCHISRGDKWPPKSEDVVKELARRGYDKAITVEFCTDSLPAEGQEFDRAKAFAGMKQDIALVRSLVRKKK